MQSDARFATASRPALDTPLDAQGLWRDGQRHVLAGRYDAAGDAFRSLLARHPEQLALLNDDPSLVPAAFNEALRHETPVPQFGRYATWDVEVAGTLIPAGSQVAVLFAAGNRDPRHYPDPDVFDVRRNPTDHLSFGYDTHTCAGQGLARLALFHIGPDIAAGRLVPVLEPFNPGDVEEIHAVYVGHGGKLPARVRAFIDFLMAEVDLRGAMAARRDGPAAEPALAAAL